MCFSAAADFAAAAGVGAMGVATLLQVRTARWTGLAALPLLFAAHQFTEGLVWLGFDHAISDAATRPFVLAFMLYAQALLPPLVAVSAWLVEPPGRRRTAIAALALLGAGLGAWTAWALFASPDFVTVEGRCLAFRNHLTDQGWVAALYAGPACLALLLSSLARVRLFGALSLGGMLVVLAVRAYALTSIWCLYVAVLSVMIWWVVRREQAAVARGTLTLTPASSI